MGFNSVIIIRNDSLHVIAENGLTFTEKIVSAIQSGGGHLREGTFVDIGIQGHVNAATLFHMAHADIHNAYLIGGNTARFIPGGSMVYHTWRDPKQVDLELIKSMADAAGYRLVRKTAKAVG